jgi:hypothetical protein
MTAEAVLAGYRQRREELSAELGRLQTGQRTAVLLLAGAIAAGLVLTAGVVVRRNSIELGCLFAVLPVILYLGRKQGRTRSAINKTQRLVNLYERAILRLEGSWAGTGVSGEGFARANHLYCRDLDVVGEGSLFELLCTCRTEIGRRSLANYLLEPTPLQEIRERQEAVRELHGRTDLREQISALGQFSFQESTAAAFADWMELPRVPVYSWLRAVAFMTSGVFVLLLIGAGGLFPWSHWALLTLWAGALLSVHAVIGLLYRDRVLASLPPTRALGIEIDVLSDGLKILQMQRFQSAKLRRIAESVREGNPTAKIGRLARLIYALTERDRDVVYAISRALLVGTQVFLAIEKWRERNSASLARWLFAWGEFEALLALSGYSYEHPENIFPRLLDTEVAFEGRALGHPLLPADVCVRNNVHLNNQTKFYVVSGSNMAGKSTLLRAIGLNAVLAYAGAPVPGDSLTLSLFSVCASLSIVDSLLNGKSKFFAEMERLRQTIETAAGRQPVLFLIDEILSGTNSRDRRTAAEAIVRTLAERGALGLLSTHDLALTEIPGLAGLYGVNVHMGSRDGANPLDFDFVLKPGVTTESSALEIARLAGVPVVTPAAKNAEFI